MSLGTEKQRARTEGEKDARRRSLIAAARMLLGRASQDAIKIADVAAAAGLAKGTAYLYFSSKEALFLAVLEDALEIWFEGFDAALKAPGKGDPAERIASVLATSLGEEPVMLGLLTTLHTRLEANASDEEILGFKRFLLAKLAQAGSTVEAMMDWPAGMGAQFFMRTHALAIGIAQISDPPSRVRTVLDAHPELEPYRTEFETEFRATLLALLRASR